MSSAVSFNRPKIRFYMGKLQYLEEETTWDSGKIVDIKTVWKNVPSATEQLTIANIHTAYENRDVIVVDPKVLICDSTLWISKDVNRGYCILHPMGTLFLDSLLNEDDTIYKGIHILKDHS